MGNTQTLGGSGGNTLKRHVENASKTGVLQFDNKKLKEVDPKFCLPNLRTLSLNDNEIQTIPTEISLMVNLKNLSLRNNQIGSRKKEKEKFEFENFCVFSFSSTRRLFRSIKKIRKYSIESKSTSNFTVVICTINRTETTRSFSESFHNDSVSCSSTAEFTTSRSFVESNHGNFGSNRNDSNRRIEFER